jgi:hypothetical protein
MLTEIVRRAMVHTVCDIGQLTPQEKRQLNEAVKRGYLSKGKGGPFSKLKTMYARPGFDFIADRERGVADVMRIAEWELRHDYSQRGRCLNLQCNHRREEVVR